MTDNMWDRTEAMAKRHEPGGTWLRLARDGDKVVVAFLGEPFPREVCFVDGQYVPFAREHEAQGLRATLRVSFNVALLPSRQMRVMEQSATFFRDLAVIRKKYGLEQYAFEIQRTGLGKDTVYKILPERPFSEEEQRAFRALPLYDFAQLYPGVGRHLHQGADGDVHVANSSDRDVVLGIVHELKALPRDAVDRFLAKFGVQRVRDLAPARLEEAKAFVQELLHEARNAAAKRPEVDPFAG